MEYGSAIGINDDGQLRWSRCHLSNFRSMGYVHFIYFGDDGGLVRFSPHASFTLVKIFAQHIFTTLPLQFFFRRVEFMSKFYQGLGYPFHPFSFKNLFEEETEKPSD